MKRTHINNAGYGDGRIYFETMDELWTMPESLPRKGIWSRGSDMNTESAVAAVPALKVINETAPIIPPDVKAALDAITKPVIDPRAANVGKTIRDVVSGKCGKIVAFHDKYAFGDRTAPAYRIESNPDYRIPFIVACDPMTRDYVIED